MTTPEENRPKTPRTGEAGGRADAPEAGRAPEQETTELETGPVVGEELKNAMKEAGLNREDLTG
ncbi:hypothetical protein PJ985_03350 [Streptomyces sp. ACA25]|uniref:hypothetical protein n=1 Tax=Streptomyces sp. ACA25 TaxID=3022596 RepID=UPI002307259D|nr:hypothetical protein [Streptomyces sp. ACA25]MDB1086602.1 hypothetical protein [Streptomyces sp. ACA25]